MCRISATTVQSLLRVDESPVGQGRLGRIARGVARAAGRSCRRGRCGVGWPLRPLPVGCGVGDLGGAGAVPAGTGRRGDPEGSVPTSVRAGVAEALPLPDACADGSCSAWSCARFRIRLRPRRRLRGCCAPVGSSGSSNTPGLRRAGCAQSSASRMRLSGRCSPGDVTPALTRSRRCARPASWSTTSAGCGFPAERFTQPSTPHVLGTARLPG